MLSKCSLAARSLAAAAVETTYGNVNAKSTANKKDKQVALVTSIGTDIDRTAARARLTDWDESFTLSSEGNGLTVTFSSVDDNKIITISGLYNHSKLCPEMIDVNLALALAQVVDPSTLLEIEVEGDSSLNHMIGSYPMPWSYINDWERCYEYGVGLDYLCGYFDEDEHNARLLRCYHSSSQLWSDPIGAIPLLRALLQQSNLLFAHPIGELSDWLARRDRPGGCGGDLSRWL